MKPEPKCEVCGTDRWIKRCSLEDGAGLWFCITHYLWHVKTAHPNSNEAFHAKGKEWSGLE